MTLSVRSRLAFIFVALAALALAVLGPSAFAQTLDPPPATQSFNVIDTTQDGIAVTWFGVKGTGISKLEIEKDGNWEDVDDGDFNTGYLPHETSNRRLMGVATGLVCETTYQFRVSAVGDGTDYAAERSQQAELSAKTDACPKERQITGLRADVTPSCVYLTWSQLTNTSAQDAEYHAWGEIEGYSVERLRGTNDPTTLTGAGFQDIDSYTDCDVTEGEDYVYIVHAHADYVVKDSNGSVIGGTQAVGARRDTKYTPRVTIEPNGAPSEPGGVEFASNTQSSRSIRWDLPPSHRITIGNILRGGSSSSRLVDDPWLTGYQVERREQNLGGTTWLEDWQVMRYGDDDNLGTGYTDSEDIVGKRYVYRVRAANSAGLSSGFISQHWLYADYPPPGGM